MGVVREDVKVDSNLEGLTDEQLHAEYAITKETLAHHKEQVGHGSAQLHELTVKLADKKKDRDKQVQHYNTICTEFTRRKNTCEDAN